MVLWNDETFQFVTDKDKALARGEKGLNGRWILSDLVIVRWIVGFGSNLCVGLCLRAWLSASPKQMGVDMEGDDNVGEAKAVTAGELVIILGQYHSAIARLGSGIISLSGALKHSEDADVKQAADEAWVKLNEFIDCMEGVADGLNALTQKKEA